MEPKLTKNPEVLFESHCLLKIENLLFNWIICQTTRFSSKKSSSYLYSNLSGCFSVEEVINIKFIYHARLLSNFLKMVFKNSEALYGNWLTKYLRSSAEGEETRILWNLINPTAQMGKLVMTKTLFSRYYILTPSTTDGNHVAQIRQLRKQASWLSFHEILFIRESEWEKCVLKLAYDQFFLFLFNTFVFWR